MSADDFDFAGDLGDKKSKLKVIGSKYLILSNLLYFLIEKYHYHCVMNYFFT